MSRPDTIAALATAGGPAAVGIVRVSGPEAFEIGRRVCARWPEPVVARRAIVTGFVDAEGRRFDVGLALPFPGPGSYTGEDVLELQGHGGHASRALLAAVCAAGARLAEPGEFTQRAFTSGKLDLVQAESVAALIAAQTDRALRAAQSNLGGALSGRVEGLADRLLALRGRVEGVLEFPEESAGAELGLAGDLAALASELAALARSFQRGRRLFQRSEVVLAGPVNAGKSSLLNALVGEERALVDAAPGTTRDLVTADVEVDGLPIRLVDTAGWREAEGVEARGVALGRAAAARAALVLWVTPVLAPEPLPDAGWLAVASQCDRGARPGPGLRVSAHTGEGLEALRSEIAARLGGVSGEDEAVVVGERQALELARAEDAVRRASSQAALELVAELLADAQSALARALGQEGEPEVLDAVFRQFCVGK